MTSERTEAQKIGIDQTTMPTRFVPQSVQKLIKINVVDLILDN